MNLNEKFFRLSALALLATGPAGCQSTSQVVPINHGYEEVGHPTHNPDAEPEAARVSFQYREPNGHADLIWPALYGVNEVIHDDIAIFVGDQSYQQPDFENPRGTKPRLFAVRAPGLPLDITDEVLWRWSKTSGKDFQQARGKLSLITPMENNGHLDLHLVFWTDDAGWPDAIYSLDWNQVQDIMHEIKAKGTEHHELRWKTPYLEKSFSN